MAELDFANWRVFGNEAFRPQQREVIQAVLQVRATVACLRTGRRACSKHACPSTYALCQLHVWPTWKVDV